MNLKKKFTDNYRKLKNKYIFNFTSYKTRFNTIYQQNLWTSQESISGPGSNLNSTETIRKELRPLIDKYNIKTILDIPCGDFHWMKKINLTGLDYIGADIVEELIHENNEKFSMSNIHFKKIDLIKDTLPKFDLIVSRDCFIHFSYELIIRALNNIISSKSTYLLASTYPDIKENKNIKTGNNFNINLEIIPFNLPKPLLYIDEKEQLGTIHGRKTMGLWSIDDIKKAIS